MFWLCVPLGALAHGTGSIRVEASYHSPLPALREKFLPLMQAVLGAGVADGAKAEKEQMEKTRKEWEGSALGAMAVVIMADQFTRNVFRGTADMYAQDSYAVDLVVRSVGGPIEEELLRLHPYYLHFFYTPLLHSENVAHHDLLEARYDWVGANADPSTWAAKQLVESRKWVGHHGAIVRKFGRFPQRNAILGRESTPEELEDIKKLGLDKLVSGKK
eukprot:Hpha_TRINITY_DN701_c0_g1::TRINITY_DN701_c0_g1_i2::g.28949::m.28949